MKTKIKKRKKTIITILEVCFNYNTKGDHIMVSAIRNDAWEIGNIWDRIMETMKEFPELIYYATGSAYDYSYQLRGISKKALKEKIKKSFPKEFKRIIRTTIKSRERISHIEGYNHLEPYVLRFDVIRWL